MAQWYVKKLSKLTNVSVKTLYHYESIGLLKPSMRLENDYRVYTEADLLKLQHILALKSFGFSLAHIKQILEKKVSTAESLLLQSRILEEKAQLLINASDTLKNVVAELGDGTSVAWETILTLIKVYSMTTQLKNSWAGKIMDDTQLKEYAEFNEGLKTRYTEADKLAWEKKWNDLAHEIRTHISEDPSSSIGIALGKRCMDMVNEIYGKKYIKLRTTIWEEGYKKGKVDPAHNWAEPAVIEWLDKAQKAYYFSRFINIANQAANHSREVVLSEWNEMLTETAAHDQQSAIINHILSQPELTTAGRNWLITLR